MLGIATAANDPAAFDTFVAGSGIVPGYALIFFDQRSRANLTDSSEWIANKGGEVMRRGVDCIWSVPFGGKGALEEIASGARDADYRRVFTAILAQYPKGYARKIWVRIAWEMNLQWQENAAIDKTGEWNGKLYADAFKQIVRVSKLVSGRFAIIWCPNVTTQGYDPELCYPGDGWVDVVGQDFYMQKQWNKAGDFSWFRDEARGLAWGAKFARDHGKLYGLTEWGMDDDRFVPDLTTAAAWMEALGPILHHHCWWDRAEVIDCRLDKPTIASTYKAAFA
jgi:hypothetical protein